MSNGQPLRVFTLPEGGRFVAHQRHEPDDPTMTSEHIAKFMIEKWGEAFEAKKAETERLKRMHRYYRGRHYNTVEMNRTNPVTNYCFSAIETLHPTLISDMPRPEIRPRDMYSAQSARDLQDFSQWKMDQVGWDRAFSVGTRDFCKFGWNINLVSIGDYGLSGPRYMSPFHYYPDPNARDESELEYFFLAMPVSTRTVRSMFPGYEGEIQADNIASPEYQVYVQDLYEEMDSDGGGYWPAAIAGSTFPSVSREGTNPDGQSYMVALGGSQIEYGRTTFVLQMFLRDRSNKKVRYSGMRHEKIRGYDIETPGSTYNDEPGCESGWRVFTMTAGGCVLQPGVKLDQCFGGIPITIGRNYSDGNSMYATGELDQLLPIQRDINRRNALIARALELSANPPLLATTNSGLARSTRYLSDGEIVWTNPGGEVGYLQYTGPSDKQFEYQSLRTRDMDVVSGQHDVSRGQRPAGIEAASAIELLQDAAGKRSQAKRPELLRNWAVLLRKLLICDGHKANGMISFYGAGHKQMAISRSALLYDFDIRWAEGSGNEFARARMEEKVMMAFQAGLLPPEYVVRELGFKDADEIAAWHQQQRAIQVETEMAAAKAGGKDKPPGKAAA